MGDLRKKDHWGVESWRKEDRDYVVEAVGG
jgi:hypothetical protein